MFVADPPAVVQSEPATDQSSDSQADVVEVVGTRLDQAQKIDRRTYRVQDNAHSAQKDSVQLLRGLPAVTISQDDQIQLLGASGVTILVDDKPIHGDALQYLRTLHGSDIERIEIITNPSAQYAAAGTGGIINIVLKKKRDDGVSGTLSAQASSFGWGETSDTVRIKKGKWTYEVQAQAHGGRSGRAESHGYRSAEIVPGGPPTINTADSREHGDLVYAFLNGEVSYDFDDKTSITGHLFGGGYRSKWFGDYRYGAVTADFTPFTEDLTTVDNGRVLGGQVSVNHKGAKPGESLNGFAVFYGEPEASHRIESDFDGSTGYSTSWDKPATDFYAQGDWVHPIGKKSILSVGGTSSLDWKSRNYRFVNIGSVPGLGPDVSDSYNAHQALLAAYATFQRQFGSWAVMPGVRIEAIDRTISSPGQPSAHVGRTNVFPTLHIDHSLSGSLDLTLSYSKRIQRPDYEQLRPYPVVYSALSIKEGNPNLLDQITDSFEANLHFHRKKLDAGLIVYDRETKGLWSDLYSVDSGGVSVMTPINSGEKRDIGAQFDVSTPIARRVKTTASINLFDSRVPISGDGGNATYASFRYTGNASLEWDGRDRGAIPGDIVQLQAFYESASREFDTRTSSHYSLNLSWTHNFTQTLSLTASADNLGRQHYRNVLTAPTVAGTYDRRNFGPEFKLKLQKTFGSPGKPDNSSPPPVPFPH